MQARRDAALLVGAIFLTIPGRSALAADPAPPSETPASVEGSPPSIVVPVAPSPPAGEVLGTAREAPPPLVEIDPFQLKGPAFYSALGRGDLAQRYRERGELKTASRILGGLSLTVGTVWVAMYGLASAFASAVNCAGREDDASCKKNIPPPIAADVLCGAGLVALVAPSFWSTDPLNDDEKRALVESVTRARTTFQPRDVHLSAAPTPDGQGATFRLAGRF
jgi:hypothetical protein